MLFRIDLKIFIIIVLFYFTRQIEIYSIIMISTLIHEIGHLIAGIIFGMKPKKIEIMPYGLSISFKIIPKDYNKKIIKGNFLELKKIFVALAGPLTNIIIIIICSNLKIDTSTKLLINYSNIWLILFNLLPIYPLDGGRILKGILHILFGRYQSEIYTNIISFISIISVSMIASILIYRFQNIAIFFGVLFLWCVYIKQDIISKKRNKIYKLVQKTIEIT